MVQQIDKGLNHWRPALLICLTVVVGLFYQNTRLTDLRTAFDRRFDDLKNQFDKRFDDLKSATDLRFEDLKDSSFRV